MDVRVRAYSRIAVPGRRAVLSCLGLLAALSFNPLTVRSAAAQEVVLHAIDVGSVSGNWARVDSSSGAGNKKMGSNDGGWSSTDAPQASPGNYFEATFNAQAWVGYRVWLRMKAAGNSKWNDSAWVQFSDSLVSGDARYRIGTSSALLVNLEECFGCGVSNWGWSGGAWWVSQPLTVEFPSDGAKTIRIQTREDGVEIDQIVLSPSSYMNTAPGRSRDDSTILPRSAGSSTPSPAPAPPPTNNAKALPGTIQAEDFDNGANGTAYWDSSSGNSGGQYRSTDVDIENRVRRRLQRRLDQRGRVAELHGERCVSRHVHVRIPSRLHWRRHTPSGIQRTGQDRRCRRSRHGWLAVMDDGAKGSDAVCGCSDDARRLRHR